LIRFEGGAIAALSASRVSQRKIRTISIAEADRLIDIDLLRHDITIYRHVVAEAFDDGGGYRQQAIMEIPVMRYSEEPLRAQLNHFIDLVRGKADVAAELDGLVRPHEVVSELTALDPAT
jgi:hypothetical protein